MTSLLEFKSIIKDIAENETVLKMKNYRQHYSTSTYTHCLNVSFYTYLICKRLKLDYISATRAAMLHDLFLYDWRTQKNKDGLHAFAHPKTAYENASKIFELNDMEKDIILKHMWPVTLAFPKYKETFVIIFTDKFSAIKEAVDYYINDSKYKKLLTSAYLFLFCLSLNRFF